MWTIIGLVIDVVVCVMFTCLGYLIAVAINGVLGGYCYVLFGVFGMMLVNSVVSMYYTFAYSLLFGFLFLCVV